MRLAVSQYLARLPDRPTNTFSGDAPLGDTSLTAGTSIQRMACPTGVKEGLWAESESGVRSNGRMGGVNGKAVKKGGASRGMGGLSIPSQTERANRNEQKGAVRRNDEQERHTHGSTTFPFIDPVVRGGGDDPWRCVVTQIGHTG